VLQEAEITAQQAQVEELLKAHGPLEEVGRKRAALDTLRQQLSIQQAEVRLSVNTQRCAARSHTHVGLVTWETRHVRDDLRDWT
jgi:hypothetical protein